MSMMAVARRFLIPGFVTSIIYALKFRCFVSHRAEVDLSNRLQIGRSTQIGSFTKLKAADGDMVIGSNSFIGSNCFITASAGGVVIGDHAMISSNVCVIGNTYSYDDLETPISQQPQISKGVRIGDNVWIGCGAVVLDGAEIGDGSIIAVNSVVSGKIPPYSIATGNPAKVVFERR